MSEAITTEVAYRCDLCGKHFDSPAGAQSHSRETHPESTRKGGSELRVTGTSTPAEDREETRAIDKSR